MNYTLYHGDCLDILPMLDPQSVDAVICDPPYGTTACKWDSVIPFAPMWEGIKRVLRPRGACVLFGSQPFTSALVMSNVAWFKYSLVWEKHKHTNFYNITFQPGQSHEDIVVFSGGAASYSRQGSMTYNPQKTSGAPWKKRDSGKMHGFTLHTSKKADERTGAGRYPRSVLRFQGVERGIHPTQKPLALLEYLVKTYTNAGDTVLDFTMGSGTTGHACGNLDRRFIGIEKDVGYFAIAEERIATAYAPLRHMQQVAV